MANHKSAVKAHRLNGIRRGRNRELRTRMRHALKAVRTAIENQNDDDASVKDVLRDTVSLIDKLVSKGVIHANAAARHKSRLAGRLRKSSAAAA